MISLRFILLMWSWAVIAASAVEPIPIREWKSKTGHKIEAKALQIADGKVQFERADGTRIEVPLDKLTDEDQVALQKHFGGGRGAASGEKATAPQTGVPADDLPYPLGKTTAEIQCGDGFSCFLYFPSTLRKGVEHPVLFVMSPGGGGEGNVGRYRDGAERNRWIVAVSKQSKNGFDGSMNAVDAMFKHVTTKLPIDHKRLYCTGFSGGSRMAFLMATKYKDIAGVIPCGAGGGVGSAKQVVYGLCGSNCFNRSDMARSFRTFKSRDSVLRYFPGQHDWAGDELCTDAITHLNGVFLLSNRTKYPDEHTFYLQQVISLIGECEAASPMRAYMWAEFLTAHGIKDPKVAEIHARLGKSEINKLYLKGLTDINEFAQGTFGNLPPSQWQSDPKVSAACKKEAKKYTGTPWEGILDKMGEDAQKF